MKNRLMIRMVGFVLALSACASAWAGSIFLTGHDPDFHASNSAGTAIDSIGAVHINQAAIAFIMDPSFNSFAFTGIDKLLCVESNMAAPGGDRIGKNGIPASGFTAGADFAGFARKLR